MVPPDRNRIFSVSVYQFFAWSTKNIKNHNKNYAHTKVEFRKLCPHTIRLTLNECSLTQATRLAYHKIHHHFSDTKVQKFIFKHRQWCQKMQQNVAFIRNVALKITKSGDTATQNHFFIKDKSREKMHIWSTHFEKITECSVLACIIALFLSSHWNRDRNKNRDLFRHRGIHEHLIV